MKLKKALMFFWLFCVGGIAMGEMVDNSFGDLQLVEYVDTEQTTPLVSVLPCKNAPVIDGVLSDPAWQESTRFLGFIDNTTRLYASRQTFVSLMYDEEALYVAMESGTEGTTPTAEDCYAIILQAPEGNAPPLVFRVSPTGEVGNASGDPIPAETVTCASRVEDARWTVELALRFKSLNIPYPGKGYWKVNFCRWWTAPKAQTSWIGQRIPSLKDIDTAETGLLLFRKNGPVLRIESYGALERKEHHLSCRFLIREEGEVLFALSDAVAKGKMSRNAHTEQHVTGEFQTLTLTDKTAGAGHLKNADAVAYSFVNKSFNRVYFRADRCPVGGAPPVIAISTTSFEKREHLRIIVDTWGLVPELVGHADVTVSLIRRASGEAVSDKDAVVTMVRHTKIVKRMLSTAIPLNQLEPGAEYTVRAEIATADGTSLDVHEASITYPDISRWMNNKLGMDDVVPTPFTPIQSEQNTIRCWGREYRFSAGSGFPTQIVTRGQEILASAPTLTLRTARGDVAWLEKNGKMLEVKDTAASFQASAKSAELSLETVSTIEYDGMMRIDMTIAPVDTVSLNGLTLVIPLKPEHARYLGVTESVGAGQRSYHFYGALPENGYRWKFIPFLWLGDEDRGLLWFCESAQYWRPKDPDAALEVTRDGEVVALRVNLIGRETSLDKPLHFTMGLQASPVRPLPENWRRMETKFTVGPTTNEHFAYVPEQLYACEDLLKKSKAAGKKISAYTFLNNVSTRLPEYNLFFDEWKRERNAAKGKYFLDVVAPNVKSWQDFVVWSWKLGLERFDIDGLYYDLVWPSPSTNPDHGGYVTEDGKPGRCWPIFAVREIAKRAYVMYRMHKQETAFIGHCSSNPIILPILSFCDFALDGEQFATVLHSYTDQVPLDKWRTEFTCRQFGMMPLFLPEIQKSGNTNYNHTKPEPTAEMAGLTYLHDIMVWGIWVHPKTMHEYQNAKMAFLADGDVEFLPYWSNGDVFSSDSESVKISAYRKRGACLMMVMNMSTEPVSTTLNVNLSALELDAASLDVKDAVSNEPLTLAGGKLKMALQNRRLYMIAITGESNVTKDAK